MNSNRTAQQMRFHTKLMTLPCVITNEYFVKGKVNQLHHCLGAKAKINKIHIGEWFVYPIAAVLHDIRIEREGEFLNIGHRHGSGSNKSEFKRINGPDIDLYLSVMDCYSEQFGDDDIDVDWDIVKLIERKLRG